MPYTCTLCDGDEPAAFLVTPLTGGETMAVGNGCTLTALTGLLAAFANVDAEKLYAAVERLAKAAVTAGEGAGAERPPRRAGGRRGAAKSQPQSAGPAEAVIT